MARHDALDDDDEPAGRSGLKRIAIGLAAVAAIGGAAAIALVVYTPVDLVRDRLVREVKARTGRDLVIGGKPSVTFWPNVAVSLADVSLSNPPGIVGPPLLTMQRLDATIQLWPLLQRRVQVDRLVLQSPRLTLSVDGSGRRNWSFAAFEDRQPRRIQVAQAGKLDLDSLPEDLRDFAKGASANRGAAAAASGDGMSLGRVRIVDGALSHRDARTGAAEDVTNIDLTVEAPDLAGPLHAAGTLTWRGEPMRIDTRFAPARALVAGTAVQATAAIGSGPLHMTYAGTFESAAKLDGMLTLKSPVLAKAAQWLGRDVVGEPANGPLSFKGRVQATGTRLGFSDGALTLNGLNLSGALAVDTGATRPKVTGNVRLAELAPDTLATLRVLEPKVRPTPPPRALQTAPPQPSAPGPKGPQSIEDLLKDDAPAVRPQVRGFLDRAGWSEQPLDLSALAGLDADLKVSLNRLGASALNAGPGHVNVALNDRVLKVSIDDLTLHEGKVRGTITVDGAAQRPSAAVNLVADGVALQPLLKSMDAEAIDGKARLTLAVNTTGRTERQMIDGLSGKAEVLVPRGAFLGLDLSRMIAGLPRGELPSFQKVAGARTDFTDLGASFVIARGVADNKDFRVVTKDVRAIGNGQIALGARTIDAVVRPKLTALVSAPAGAGGPGAALGGLDLPIRITGPLDQPSVKADFGAALKDPNAVVDAVKQLDRNGEVQDTVKGLISGDEAAKKKARDLLNNILKR